MKKKILIIPSWYPNKDNPLLGSFYREQASLLGKKDFDISVLFGIEKQVSRLKYFALLVRSFLKPQKHIWLEKSFLEQNPDAYSFIAYYPRKCSTKKKLKIINSYYEKAFTTLSQNWKPDLLHAQCAANAGIYAHHLSNKTGVPFVIIEHQTFILNYHNKVTRGAIVKAMENASKVGVVSYYQKRNILLNHINCDPKVVWNLVNETEFNIEPRQPNAKFTILTITYPGLIKDADTFFKAIEAFDKISNTPFEVVIVGNDAFGDLKKANSSIFRDAAKKHGIFDKCVFIPKLNREDINRQLQQADVFVSTSISETFGIAIREAMLCGTPVIATKSGGVEDSINYKTGVLVNIKDHETIAENLLNIATKAISFSPEDLRNHIIEQSGTTAFIKTMTNFYS